MKITIEATDQMTKIEGVEVRVWKGVTERGVDCLVFIPMIAVEVNADKGEFDRELKETMPPPTPAIPFRMVAH